MFPRTSKRRMGAICDDTRCFVSQKKRTDPAADSEEEDVHERRAAMVDLVFKHVEEVNPDSLSLVVELDCEKCLL